MMNALISNTKELVLAWSQNYFINWCNNENSKEKFIVLSFFIFQLFVEIQIYTKYSKTYCWPNKRSQQTLSNN